MPICGRLCWLQRKLERGHAITCSSSFNEENGKLKYKFLVGTKAGAVPAMFQLFLAPALQHLIQCTELDGVSITDRGHKHSNGVSETCLWISLQKRDGSSNNVCEQDNNDNCDSGSKKAAPAASDPTVVMNSEGGNDLGGSSNGGGNSNSKGRKDLGGNNHYKVGCKENKGSHAGKLASGKRDPWHGGLVDPWSSQSASSADHGHSRTRHVYGHGDSECKKQRIEEKSSIKDQANDILSQVFALQIELNSQRKLQREEAVKIRAELEEEIGCIMEAEKSRLAASLQERFMSVAEKLTLESESLRAQMDGLSSFKVDL